MNYRYVLPVVIGALASAAGADIVTQWNFNSNPPDASLSTGTTDPSIGAGTASLIGGVAGSFGSGVANGGSSDTAATDNTGWQTTTYGTTPGIAGVQFAASTVGYSGITVNFDTRHSNTSSRFLQFQYSLDGSTFSSAGLAGDGVFVGNAGDTWFNLRTVDLTSITGANNNANFAFRIVAIFDPNGSGFVASNTGSSYASSGTLRWDMVTINGSVPAPGSVALLAVGGLVAARRRRA